MGLQQSLRRDAGDAGKIGPRAHARLLILIVLVLVIDFY
jgi:hypothetical protein